MTDQHTPRQLGDWLAGFVADHLDIPTEEIARDLSLKELGVDSATTLVLAANLSALLRRNVRPVDIFQHPTIDALVVHLTGPVAGEVRDA